MVEAKSEGPGLRVAVIGCGLGGLSVCLSLQRAGIECTIYEKDADFMVRRQGYGMTLARSPAGPLGQLGVLEDCIAQDCPSHWHWVFDREGAILGYYGREFRQQGESSSPDTGERTRETGNLRVPRRDLQNMLLTRLNAGSVKWGWQVEGYEEAAAGTGVQVNFTNGEKVFADVLVGADGIRSTIRAIRDECLRNRVDTPLRYVGVSVIIGLSSARHPLLESGGFYMLDGTNRLFTMPYRVVGDEQTTMWQLSFAGLSEAESQSLRGWSQSQLLGEALRRTDNTFSPIRELIEQTLPHEVWGTGLYDRDPMALLSRGSETVVTVVGDAAHPMSMFKGQGANQALADGPLLAGWLSKPGASIATKLRCFEREMMARAGPKVLASRAAAERLHSRDSLQDEFGISGVPKSKQQSVLEALAATNITANLGEKLELETRQVIRRLVFEENPQDFCSVSDRN